MTGIHIPLSFFIQSPIKRLKIYQVAEFVLCKSPFLLILDTHSPIKGHGIYQVAEFVLYKSALFINFWCSVTNQNTWNLPSRLVYSVQRQFFINFYAHSPIKILGIYQVAEFVLRKSAFLWISDTQSSIKRHGTYPVAELFLCQKSFFVNFDVQSPIKKPEIYQVAEFVLCKSVFFINFRYSVTNLKTWNIPLSWVCSLQKCFFFISFWYSGYVTWFKLLPSMQHHLS